MAFECHQGRRLNLFIGLQQLGGAHSQRFDPGCILCQNQARAQKIQEQRVKPVRRPGGEGATLDEQTLLA